MRKGWSLEGEQWEAFFAILTGTAWTKCYLEAMYRDVVPASAGVYLICARPREVLPHFPPLYEVVYVGQEGVSLRRRFLEHCTRPKLEIQKSRGCFRPPLDYWFCQAASVDLDKLEGVLIDSFGPPANLVRKLTVRLGPGQPA
jgi:hypothetical protein